MYHCSVNEARGRVVFEDNGEAFGGGADSTVNSSSRGVYNNNNNNNNEIFIKCEPLIYTRARRAIQGEKKRKKKERKARTVQQQ